MKLKRSLYALGFAIVLAFSVAACDTNGGGEPIAPETGSTALERSF